MRAACWASALSRPPTKEGLGEIPVAQGQQLGPALGEVVLGLADLDAARHALLPATSCGARADRGFSGSCGSVSSRGALPGSAEGRSATVPPDEPREASAPGPALRRLPPGGGASLPDDRARPGTDRGGRRFARTRLHGSHRGRGPRTSPRRRPRPGADSDAGRERAGAVSLRLRRAREARQRRATGPRPDQPRGFGRRLGRPGTGRFPDRRSALRADPRPRADSHLEHERPRAKGNARARRARPPPPGFRNPA